MEQNIVPRFCNEADGSLVPWSDDTNGWAVGGGKGFELGGSIIDENMSSEEGFVEHMHDIGGLGVEHVDEPACSVVRPGGAVWIGSRDKDHATDSSQLVNGVLGTGIEGQGEGEAWSAQDLLCERPAFFAENLGEIESIDVVYGDVSAYFLLDLGEDRRDEVGHNAVDIDSDDELGHET